MTRMRPRTALLVAMLALMGVVAPSAHGQTGSFSSGSGMTLASGAPASPYPSAVDVAGMSGPISEVSVTLTGVSVGASDLDVVLVSPHGETVMLTSDVMMEVDGATWTFDDDAPNLQADGSSGIYKPTNVDGGSDALSDPAPAGPYGTTMSALDGQAANGAWKLFAHNGNLTGTIGGWSLEITTSTGEFQASPTAKDFGTVEVGVRSALQAVTVTNSGNSLMSITATDLQGTSPEQFLLSENQCVGSVLQPAEACTMNVSFKPTSSGAKGAQLRVDHTGAGSSHVVGLAGTGSQSQAPPAGGDAPTVPTSPQETGSADIRIESAAFTVPPRAGGATTLHIEASNPDERVTGVIVDFGETLGLFAASSCVPGLNRGGTAVFDIPYRFSTSGSHTVTVTILSGGCGRAETRTRTFTIDVATATTARASSPTAVDAAKKKRKRRPKSCRDTTLLPTPAVAKRITKALLCVMNLERAKRKLKPLRSNKRLAAAALTHSRAMIAGQFFAHQGPTEPGLAARLRSAGYRSAASENLAAGAGPLATPRAIVTGWLNSPIHRANLLSKRYRAVGIGFLAQFPLSSSAAPAATYTANFGAKP